MTRALILALALVSWAVLITASVFMLTPDEEANIAVAANAELEASMRTVVAKAADIERELTGLQTKRTGLSERLADVKGATKEAWAKTRDATVDAFEELTDGINAAAKKFGQ